MAAGSDDTRFEEIWSKNWSEGTTTKLLDLRLPGILAKTIIEYSAPRWKYCSNPKGFRLVGEQAEKLRRSEDSVFYEEPLSKGVWEISVRLDALGEPASDSSDSDTDFWTHVGFSPEGEGVRDLNVVGWSRGSVSLFQSGTYYTNRMVLKDNSRLTEVGYGCGDVVTARVDFEKRILSFAINSIWDSCQHPLWPQPAPCLWFGVTMSAPGQSAEIVRIARSL
uniref:B30.2/SPRY domain-containing protein n=1 Tax=Lotharella oceanica TaxID=641309 RepID=A0A7S2XJ49_9EUKA